jgi:hypothetical protein
LTVAAMLLKLYVVQKLLNKFNSSFMKTILSILIVFLLTFLVSSSTSYPVNKDLAGKWKATWSNKNQSNIQTEIVWQLNEDGTGYEINTVTTSIQAIQSKIVLKYPLNWKTTKSDSAYFLSINYGLGQIIQQEKQLTQTPTEIDNRLADSLIQIKSSLNITFKYFYYGDDMLYVNDFLDGAKSRSTYARTKFVKEK